MLYGRLVVNTVQCHPGSDRGAEPAPRDAGGESQYGVSAFLLARDSRSRRVRAARARGRWRGLRGCCTQERQGLWCRGADALSEREASLIRRSRRRFCSPAGSSLVRRPTSWFLGGRHGLAPRDEGGRLWGDELQLTIADFLVKYMTRIIRLRPVSTTKIRRRKRAAGPRTFSRTGCQCSSSCLSSVQRSA